MVEFLPLNSEAAGSNLGLGASCWKVGSYLPMPGGLECSMHCMVSSTCKTTRRNMTLAVECDVKHQNKSKSNSITIIIMT